MLIKYVIWTLWNKRFYNIETSTISWVFKIIMYIKLNFRYTVLHSGPLYTRLFEISLLALYNNRKMSLSLFFFFTTLYTRHDNVLIRKLFEGIKSVNIFYYSIILYELNANVCGRPCHIELNKGCCQIDEEYNDEYILKFNNQHFFIIEIQTHFKNFLFYIFCVFSVH